MYIYIYTRVRVYAAAWLLLILCSRPYSTRTRFDDDDDDETFTKIMYNNDTRIYYYRRARTRRYLIVSLFCFVFLPIRYYPLANNSIYAAGRLVRNTLYRTFSRTQHSCYYYRLPGIRAY